MATGTEFCEVLFRRANQSNGFSMTVAVVYSDKIETFKDAFFYTDGDPSGRISQVQFEVRILNMLGTQGWRTASVVWGDGSDLAIVLMKRAIP